MDPNVLLVILDSVRARNTSLHGYDNETTPFLSSFGQDRSTWYTQARSPAATSLTSHASIFTGLAVTQHGITATNKKLEPGVSIFEQLAEDGYETGVFSENTWITNVDAGLNRFDTVVGPQNLPFPSAVDPREFVATEGQGNYHEFLSTAFDTGQPIRSLVNGLAIKLEYDYPALYPDFLNSKASGEVYIDAFLNWQSRQSGPWAACLNLMDAHIPYEPPAEYDMWGGDQARAIQESITEQKWEFAGGERPWWHKRALEGLYDGSIRYIDALLEHLVNELDSRNGLEDTILVITADHGEGFGERSHIRPVRIAEHNVAIHESLTHVPLLVHMPGKAPVKQVDKPVSLSAFPQAVARARDGQEPSFVTEDPVVSVAVGLDEPKQRRAEPYVDDMVPYTATSKAVYENSPDQHLTKYITWNDETRTIGIPDSRTSFVISQQGEQKVESVFKSLTDVGVAETGASTKEMDDTTREQLEDLGYI
jgi:arylsulfatase